jgi:DUF4097 and DUF4098 domain-containing protein YvlB
MMNFNGRVRARSRYTDASSATRWAPRVRGRWLIGLLALIGIPGFASGQERPATAAANADARVTIENTSGSITVTGWDRNEVAVIGGRSTLRNLELDGNPKHVQIRMNAGSSLEVRVPRKAQLRAQSSSGFVHVEGVEGTVDIESASGTLQVEGRPREIHATGFSGGVTILGGGSEVTRAESVSGTVMVTRASGVVEAKSSSGGVNVKGDVREAVLFSVSGSVMFDGTVADGGRLSAESSSGSVELSLPRNASAEYDLTTISADVDNDFGPPATKSRNGGVGLRFTVGNGGARIKGASVSGSVRLQAR